MSQNFFTALLVKLNNISTKSKLLDEVFLAQENIESMSKLFTREKIYSLIQESVVDANDIVGICNSLISYKYRLSHDKKQIYNSNTDSENKDIVEKIDTALIFMLNMIKHKFDDLKVNPTFGNFLIRVYFNEILPEEFKKFIKNNIEDISFSKDWLEDVYWLNVPIGQVTKNIVNQKLLKDFAISDFIALLDKESFSDTHRKHVPGIVFIEILMEKLKDSTMSYDELEKLMNSNALRASFMSSRQIPVCKLMMDLASLIKKGLSESNVEQFEKENINKNLGFSSRDIFILSIVGSMTEKQIIRFVTCAVSKNNVESVVFFLNSMPVRIGDSEKDPSVDSSLSIIAYSSFVKPYVIEIRKILASCNISLKENDFINILMTSKSARNERFREAIQEWALEIVLENSIPKSKSESPSMRKASVKF